VTRLPSWIEEIRGRLASPPPKRLAGVEARHAAVLVPLYVAHGQLWTLLTRRSQELPHHRGQIAFPGGGRETGEDFWRAALRESEEEIGLPTRLVLRLGELDEVGTPSGFRIVPCVGAIPHPFDPRPNPGEIAEVFAAPVRAFAAPEAVEDREVVLNGRPRTLRVYRLGRHRVWGVTARIVQNLVARLGLDGGAALG
jgi:8-oxo-dGTP pyrophosphatase MutT (NUDIX family)